MVPSLKRKRMGIEPTRPAELISPVLKTGTVTRAANASESQKNTDNPGVVPDSALTHIAATHRAAHRAARNRMPVREA